MRNRKVKLIGLGVIFGMCLSIIISKIIINSKNVSWLNRVK